MGSSKFCNGFFALPRIQKWVVVNFAMGFFPCPYAETNGLLVSFATSFLSCPYPEMGCLMNFASGFFCIPARCAIERVLLK
jgi:hypothetical protein